MIYFGVMRGDDYKTTTTFSGDAGPKLCPPKLLYIFFFRMCHRIPNTFWCDLLGIHWDTPPKFNSSGPEKLPKPRRRGPVFQPFIFSGELLNLAVNIFRRIGPDFQSQSSSGILWLWPLPRMPVANKGL